jgi:hypothetical protein
MLSPPTTGMGDPQPFGEFKAEAVPQVGSIVIVDDKTVFQVIQIITTVTDGYAEIGVVLNRIATKDEQGRARPVPQVIAKPATPGLIVPTLK